ncbi:MAG TPA: putative Fe-S cluster assembly protein SufT [Vicinamibacteria bacterium]|nr:putative Fe-S cluster assembly protein SufT [Vicinamibacteria bacterium]
MVMREARVLSRDVEVAAIPYGDRLTLTAGTTVFVTQALGGSYTAMTDHGYLVRIEGQDGDAIGERPTKPLGAEDVAGRTTEQMAWEQLRSCYDPEIPVNIVDLGLVYKVEAQPADDGDRVRVEFTLTAPGCGMGDFLRQDIEQKLRAIPGVKEAEVQVVLDPPWDQSMMSDAARLQLGLM